MDVLRWKDVLSSEQLLSCSGFWHDESGSSVCHSSSSYIWSEKCLHPHHVSGRVPQYFCVYTLVYVCVSYFKLREIPPLFRMQKLPRLLVATAEGHLFIYNLNPLDGGECTLAHEYK